MIRSDSLSVSGGYSSGRRHLLRVRPTCTIRIADGGYETYHTYPEYDLALHTETTMTPKTQR
ncbi:hypothetical protein C9J85_18285 [Haloferax sp. wsp5]|nr:hypothetical protein C9J85_18285 [Haloferax sp. wsp5]